MVLIGCRIYVDSFYLLLADILVARSMLSTTLVIVAQFTIEDFLESASLTYVLYTFKPALSALSDQGKYPWKVSLRKKQSALVTRSFCVIHKIQQCFTGGKCRTFYLAWYMYNKFNCNTTKCLQRRRYTLQPLWTLSAWCLFRHGLWCRSCL